MSLIFAALVALVLLTVLAMMGLARETMQSWFREHMDGVGGRNLENGIEMGLLGLVLAVIAAPFYLVWILITKGWPALKTKVAEQSQRKALRIAAQDDPIWDEPTIKTHVEKVFALQRRSRVSRDQSFVKEYLTPRLADHQQRDLDRLRARHEKNMLEKMKLLDVRVVKVDDQADPTQDRLWTQIRATKIDFLINEQNGQITGSSAEQKEYTEVWKFVRSPQGWLLDEIV